MMKVTGPRKLQRKPALVSSQQLSKKGVCQEREGNPRKMGHCVGCPAPPAASCGPISPHSLAVMVFVGVVAIALNIGGR